MARIDPRTKKALFQQLVEANLHRQVLLLRDFLSVSLNTGFRLDLHAVRALHASATTFLVENPGEYRNCPAHVTYSPDLKFAEDRIEIEKQMLEFICELHRRWNKDDAFALAAFALWKLNRIYPFEDGNGRTARAVAQHILHAKYGKWFPGRVMVAKLIDDHGDAYLRVLRHADQTDSIGEVDLMPMAEFLAEMLTRQLDSAFLPADA